MRKRFRNHLIKFLNMTLSMCYLNDSKTYLVYKSMELFSISFSDMGTIRSMRLI
jgi:hypothetical protein